MIPGLIYQSTLSEPFGLLLGKTLITKQLFNGKNNIIRAVIENSDNDLKRVYDIKYEYNNKNVPIKNKVFINGSLSREHSYTYY